ncbi:slit homolog 1 protein-like [Uloborus diversus]|uniref:slit homolog 1 protein-like n=1 Tax=Uloborus diversus TaxID=327109 RepID=UPI00240A5079|nr:slit homolog 1 protein-like [Uloborus diversus]
MENENNFPFRRETKERNAPKTPCVCRWSLQNCGCRCNGSLSYDDFQELSRAFKMCRNFSFSITGGEHYALPPNLFSNIGIVGNIQLNVTNATFEYLFDPTPNTSAFKGVRFRDSAVIKISGVKVRRGWNWTPLVYLKGFTSTGADLELRGCGLRRLSSDFSRILDGDVDTLSISNSRLEMIAGGSFASFENISRLFLPQNHVQSLRRSDFPPKPQNLAEIDLRENRIEVLEDDLFFEMPSLQVVFLSGNPIHMLSEKTFSVVVGNVHLPGISTFPLFCNCELQWMKNSTLQENLVFMNNIQGITCKRPPHLRGKPFSDLSKEHLLC